MKQKSKIKEERIYKKKKQKNCVITVLPLYEHKQLEELKYLKQQIKMSIQQYDNNLMKKIKLTSK